MRVIGGSFRGRALLGPDGLETRPITDRVKETLFNILGVRLGTLGAIPPVEVLDVFAGTGSLGIEAVSRGARRCVFIERNRRTLRALRANLTTLGLSDSCAIVTDNAWAMRPPASAGGFGLIFVDPPYADAADTARVRDLLERLAAGLARDGLLVFRHEAHQDFPAGAVTGLRCADHRSYGRMRLLFYRRADAPEDAPGDDGGATTSTASEAAVPPDGGA